MTAVTIDDTQRRAARVVGFCYLFAMVLAIFGENYVRGSLLVADNATATAQNIMAHERLFRVGIVGELLTFASDVTLITSLYVILSPVSKYLALLAAALRIVQAAVCVVMTSQSFDALRILSGAKYLRVVDADTLAALARLSLSAHGSTYGVAFVFLGLGSTVFGYLWWKSRYVPAALGVLGIVASFLLGVGSLVPMIVPSAWRVMYPAYMVPMFFFEVGMGLWLLVKGLPRMATISSSP
jgi:hypothetical protein